MKPSTRSTLTVPLIVALGGFLMGFDASVISGVVGFIEVEFDLTSLQLGWSVASLTLAATLAMMLAGPLSDRIGRLPVLKMAAVLFAVSAVASALATDVVFFVVARMIGGLGVGAALIIAPMYIAEIAPAKARGRMVSYNQLNIVIGISAAFFSNYVILKLGQSDTLWVEQLRLGEWSWRYMLAIEMLPAIGYFLALHVVPESPRWLAMRGRDQQALGVLASLVGTEQANAELQQMRQSLSAGAKQERVSARQLFQPAMKLVLTIGVAVAILQQITGINSVFFYAPMIFEQSGIGKDAAFMQAVLVGIVNLAFTVIAILLIDRLGRRPLLGAGLAGIAVCMLLLAYSFGSASYTLGQDGIDSLPADIDRSAIAPLVEINHDSDVAFRRAAIAALGEATYKRHESALIAAAITMNPKLVLVGILGFVASFAVSLGPIMWVLFSELFPNRLRGLAISFVGLLNSATSFGVQLVFPWELEHLGSSTTFLIYAVFAIAGLLFVMRLLPETKGKTLEELERTLVSA